MTKPVPGRLTGLRALNQGGVAGVEGGENEKDGIMIIMGQVLRRYQAKC